MSVAMTSTPSDLDVGVQYRALSTMAVMSLVLGLLSASAGLAWSLGAIPALGILTGALAWYRIRSNPSELTGTLFAQLGVGLSVLFWGSGWGWLAYEYATEVPDGYLRISYTQLQPEHSGQLFPPSALDLDGKQVFIKGYVYPGAQTKGIRQFVLVRDNGTCCFGGPAPKTTDMIEVTLQDPLRLEYSTRMRKLGGILRVQPSDSNSSLGQVIYHLDADYLR